jgi:hypothetical protein
VAATAAFSRSAPSPSGVASSGAVSAQPAAPRRLAPRQAAATGSCFLPSVSSWCDQLLRWRGWILSRLQPVVGQSGRRYSPLRSTMRIFQWQTARIASLPTASHNSMLSLPLRVLRCMALGARPSGQLHDFFAEHFDAEFRSSLRPRWRWACPPRRSSAPAAPPGNTSRACPARRRRRGASRPRVGDDAARPQSNACTVDVRRRAHDGTRSGLRPAARDLAATAHGLSRAGLKIAATPVVSVWFCSLVGRAIVIPSYGPTRRRRSRLHRA